MNRYKITEEQFLKVQQQLLNKNDVTLESGQLYCSMVGKGFCPYEHDNGKCKIEGNCTNHIRK